MNKRESYKKDNKNKNSYAKKDENHIIVCKESLDNKEDIIEKFVNSNLKGTTQLRYNYCNEKQ
ncbi:18098_t:CDS:2, partial [Gigaspora margarita]